MWEMQGGNHLPRCLCGKYTKNGLCPKCRKQVKPSLDRARRDVWENNHIGTTHENLKKLPDDVKRELAHVLEALDGLEEHFLLIGGTAVMAYNPYRVSFDVDLLTYHGSAAEKKALALYPQYLPASRGEKVGNYFFKGEWAKVHVMVVPFESFDITWASKKRRAGLGERSFFVPHIDRLIEMKRLSARPVDLEDVKALEAVRKKWK